MGGTKSSEEKDDGEPVEPKKKSFFNRKKISGAPVPTSSIDNEDNTVTDDTVGDKEKSYENDSPEKPRKFSFGKKNKKKPEETDEREESEKNETPKKKSFSSPFSSLRKSSKKEEKEDGEDGNDTKE